MMKNDSAPISPLTPKNNTISHGVVYGLLIRILTSHMYKSAIKGINNHKNSILINITKDKSKGTSYKRSKNPITDPLTLFVLVNIKCSRTKRGSLSYFILGLISTVYLLL